MQDIAVGDDIVLAFQTQLSVVASAGFAAERHIILERDGFGADETAFKIGVDDSRGLRRLTTRARAM